MSETEEFRVQSPVRSVREGSMERSSPIRHVDFNPGTPKSWSRQGTLDDTSSLEDPSLERSSPVRHVDFHPGTPKSWSRQGTLEENPSEAATPIRHVEFNPGSPRSLSRQGTLDEPKENLSRPTSPFEKPVQLPAFEESNQPSQTPKEPEKTGESGTGGFGPVEGDPTKGGDGQDARRPIADGQSGQSGRNGNTGGVVGEWNSLPVLVGRLRAALELSLGSGSQQRQQREGEETAALPEDSGVDSEEDFRVRSWTAVQEEEVKKDLKFLEELLLSDIETALSRLRSTLERIDVGALARQGAAADPNSKLHLLKLVSSLLSRLPVPEEPPPEKKPPIESPMEPSALLPQVPAPAAPRKRRVTRHTIGVSSEELASARRWLEEERDRQTLLDSRKPPSPDVPVPVAEELHHDKCTKDAINQRQSLRDKTKESAREQRTPQARGLAAAPAQPEPNQLVAAHAQYQPKPQGCQEAKAEPAAIDAHENEEGRVSQLAAALRQRAEIALSAGRFSGNNKFSAKKSRIKRANTVDIPSYLKLQAESQEASGCVSLRRPIHVGDRTGPGTTTLNILPSFQPRTENDRKFLALINKNNELPSVNNQPGPFKPFGYNKPSEPSALVNKNWNSRFSNIKTTFDKPSTEPSERASLKNRMAKRFPPAWNQTEPPPGSNLAKEKSPAYTSSPSLKNESGFRHAASSPFRRIEKPVPLSPATKVPPAYHWAKNGVQVATSSIKEKAKMMFDRDKLQPRGPLQSKEPSGFPRPPWIDEQNKGAQNGRLDYRSFCKQFAPFVGKAVDSKLRGFEEQKNHATSRRDSQVVDGRISFRMVPSTGGDVPERRREPAQLARERLSGGDSRVFGWPEGKSGKVGDPSGKEASRVNCLRGSSSVGVQTGLEEDHHGEARSFRVAPRIAKGPPSLSANASVQTSAAGPESTTYAQPSQPRHFILDHNQNYRVIPQLANDTPMTPSSLELAKPDKPPENFYPPEPIEKPRANLPEQKPRESSSNSQVKSFAPSIFNSESRVEAHGSNVHEPRMDWPVDDPGFLDDENIQNQDISPEVGVVTRYTCAIATVESVDSPEPRSEEAGAADSRTPSSPSPSPSWSRSRPPTNGATTPEEEIRRHNMLQQSLVRRLQNERTSLNEPASPMVSPNYSPSRTPNNLQESYEQPARLPSSYQTQDYYQPSNFLEAPTAHQSARFLSPSAVTVRAQEHPVRVPSPTAVGPANRINALREAYEQPLPPRPMQKERSPIPNGVNPIDSSDEYLVSCASKPSRSIVLSKSESWHQLAVNNSHNYPRAPRLNVPSGTSQVCQNLPKPPKAKSPSTQKLRSKQYEASSASDSVKKMEEKIRRYFDGPSETLEVKESRSRRSSPRQLGKGLVGLSRSRTMPGICDEKLRLSLPKVQLPLLNVNTADVDKVFDDLFEEATRTDSHHC